MANLSSVLHSLNMLLQQNVKWEWTTDCEQESQKSINSYQVWTHYDPKLCLYLAGDFPWYGIGAVLLLHVVIHLFPALLNHCWIIFKNVSTRLVSSHGWNTMTCFKELKWELNFFSHVCIKLDRRITQELALKFKKVGDTYIVLYCTCNVKFKAKPDGGGGVKCSSHKGQQMAPNIKISYAGNWSFPIIDDWIKWRNHESSVRALNLRVLLSKAVLTFLASFITLSAIVRSIFIICSIVGALVIQQRFVCPDHTHSAELNFRATTL